MVRRIVLILGILALVTFGVLKTESLRRSLGMIGERIGVSLAAPARFIGDLAWGGGSGDLKRENAILKAEIVSLSHGFFSPKNGHLISAHVFSSYPFNHRDILVLDAGSNEGVSLGSGVLVGDVLLLGYVQSVTLNTSNVRTIFDADVSIPVKIGEKGIDALLVGGRTPQLTLIVSEAVIGSGDSVYSAGSQFPYGLSLGEVDTVKAEPGSAFKTATLKIAYDPGNLDAVSILTP